MPVYILRPAVLQMCTTDFHLFRWPDYPNRYSLIWKGYAIGYIEYLEEVQA